MFKKTSMCHIRTKCVEVSIEADRVCVRNSEKKDIITQFTHDEWNTFIEGVKSGEFNPTKPKKEG